MKSLLKHATRGLWRGLAPLRRPVARKLDAWLGGIVEGRVRALVVEENERLHTSLAGVREQVDRTKGLAAELTLACRENTLLLDSLVRELVRTQRRLDAIREGLEENARGTVAANSPEEPLMIG